MSKLVKLNANYIDAECDENGKMSFHMRPDDELKNIIKNHSPKSIYNRIPREIRNIVTEGKSIRLDTECITVINGDIFHCK